MRDDPDLGLGQPSTVALRKPEEDLCDTLRTPREEGTAKLAS